MIAPAPQEQIVALRVDTSSLERKVDELAAKVDALMAYLTGQAAPVNYTAQEAARYLKVSNKRIYELIAAKKLGAMRVGSQWRITAKHMQEFIEGAQPRVPRSTVVSLGSRGKHST